MQLFELPFQKFDVNGRLVKLHRKGNDLDSYQADCGSESGSHLVGGVKSYPRQFRSGEWNHQIEFRLVFRRANAFLVFSSNLTLHELHPIAE